MNYMSYKQQDFLMHHGILGQKWGIRRYQNKDGSLTEAGRNRYSTDSGRFNERKKETDIDSARIDAETFSKQMARSGWSSKTSDYGTGRVVESTSRCKFGPKEVDIKALYDTSMASIGPEELCFIASKVRDKYVNEYKKVLSTTTETIARDLYDGGYFMKYHGDDPKYNSWTRQDFKKNMANMIQSIELNTEFAERMPDAARSLVTFRGEGKYKDLFFGDAPTIVYDIYGDKTLFLTELTI